MRNALFVSICLLLALGCNLANFQNKNSQNSANNVQPTATPTAMPSPSPSASITPTETPKPSIIATLKKSAGKYPYEIKLLENPELKARLKKLLGKDFQSMKENWNVETPIEVSGKVLKTSGCEQHNCGDNMYVMFVDLEKDNINVYHMTDYSGTTTYFEKGKIPLPPKFASEVETQTQDDDQ